MYIRRKKIFFVTLVVLFCAFLFAQEESGVEKTVIRWSRGSSINEYLARYKGEIYPTDKIVIPAISYSEVDGGNVSIESTYEGVNDVIKWTDGGSITWNFDVKTQGLYFISLDYIPLPWKGMEIEFEVRVDGEVPHDDFMSVRFPRIWHDASSIRKDVNDNELYPEQEEVPQWTTREFIDTQGFYNKSLPLFLSEGNHTFTLELKREALAIKNITFGSMSLLKSYEELNKEYQDKGYADAPKGVIKVQAEKTYLKSDSTLIPTYDRTDAATEPAHPSKIRLNTIGGNWTWKLPGQWAEWQVEAPETGLYKFYIKARQNSQRGMSAVRKISVDGVIPCKEFENMEIPYSLKWGIYTPKTATGEECYIYLTKGIHSIRMESTLGELTSILTAVDDLTYEVNTLRRRFVMIMGSEPDKYRDYQLEKEIPGLKEKLVSLSDRFDEQAILFEEISGQAGSEASTLRIMRDQLASFAEEPEYISHKQSNFRDNIATLATWILYRKEIPMELDYLGICSPLDRTPKAKANFFAQQWHNIRAFFASFFEDYNSIGAQNKGSVKVWISSGRDQAQVLRDLITNDFTPNTGIDISLSLVQGSLIEATLAGRGPEVAIFAPRGQPVDLAARNALYDISKFDTYPEVVKRYNHTSMIPYMYQGGTYALPLTQDFHMMFYRKDILEELNLEPPETWEDLYRMIPTLQRNNMQIGLPYQQSDALELINAGMGARNLFPTLLAQRNGEFYLDDNSRSGLGTPEAYSAFKQWVDFYSDYGFTLKYDFYTRFRAGEMPIGIANYAIYNQLTAAAPEIRNEWAMTLIPGIRQEDGTINRSEAASGSAMVMFKHIKNPEDGWKFMEWWTSDEVQLKYAQQLEVLLGTAARYNPANQNTFEKMAWSNEESQMIKTQWDSVREYQEVPGGYYTIRMLDTAFTKVYYDNKNARATLIKYADMIDEEIQRKKEELSKDE